MRKTVLFKYVLNNNNQKDLENMKLKEGLVSKQEAFVHRMMLL